MDSQMLDEYNVLNSTLENRINEARRIMFDARNFCEYEPWKQVVDSDKAQKAYDLAAQLYHTLVSIRASAKGLMVGNLLES